MQPQYLSVDAGDAVEFHCVANGHPLPRIEWTRADGRPLPFGSVVDDGVLRLQRVNVEGQGEYQCAAFNALGSVRASALLEIRTGFSSQTTVTCIEPISVLQLLAETSWFGEFDREI